MSKITLAPNVSGAGTFTVAAPGTETDRTLTLPDATGTLATEAFATAAAGDALLKEGGAMTGAITTSSTFDGRSVATDGIKLDLLDQGLATTDSPTFVNLTVTGTVDGRDVATDGAKLDISAALTTNTFTGAQIGSVTALTSTAAAMAIDLATNNNFSHETTENTTLSAPSNPVAGQSGVITITQGGTARTLAYNTFWKFAGGTVPTLTATAAQVDVFVYNVESATRATCQLLKDVK
jgi:hypothetical protein